jgi:hypothetical protein
MEKIIVGRFLYGRPSSAPTPAHLRARAGLLARYRATITDRCGPLASSLFPQISPPLLGRVATQAKLPATRRPPVPTPRRKDGRMLTCHLEPSRQLRCAMVSQHHCPPVSTPIGDASIGFRSRPLGDKVLEQAAPLAKLPLPNVCRGGHHLALLAPT